MSSLSTPDNKRKLTAASTVIKQPQKKAKTVDEMLQSNLLAICGPPDGYEFPTLTKEEQEEFEEECGPVTMYNSPETEEELEKAIGEQTKVVEEDTKVKEETQKKLNNARERNDMDARVEAFETMVKADSKLLISRGKLMKLKTKLKHLQRTLKIKKAALELKRQREKLQEERERGVPTQFMKNELSDDDE